MLDDELIEWDILYATNTVSFGNGNISALFKGETAIKAKLGTVEAEAEAISAFLKADSGESGGSTSLKKYKITAEKTENGRIKLSQTSVNRGNAAHKSNVCDDSP